MIKHSSPISGIASFQGKYVLTAGYDNKVILWDAYNRQALAQGNHDHLANQCAFSPCGKLAASSSSDYSVRLWRTPDMQLISLLTVHKDDVEGVVFHPSKKILATCSRDKSIAVFNYEGQCLSILVGHQADVTAIDWLNSTDVLISSSDDGTVKYWNAITGKLIRSIDFDGVETDTITVGNHDRLYAGNDEGEIIVLSDQNETVIKAHKAGIKKILFDAKQNLLISLSYDRTFKIWQCLGLNLRCLHTTTFPEVVWPHAATFLNKNTLIFTTFGSSYAQYDIAKSEWLLEHIEETSGYNASCELDGTLYSIGDSGKLFLNGNKKLSVNNCCNFLEAFGTKLITGGQNGKVLNALTGTCYYQHHSPINCAVSFQQDNIQKLIVGSYTGEFLVFSQDSDQKVYFEQIIKAHSNAIKGIACSDSYIFSVCADTSMALYDTSNFELISYQEDAHSKIANGCAVSSNNNFVSVSRDRKLRIWALTTNKTGAIGLKPTTVSTPSQHSIKCVALSSDGDMVAIGNYTGHVGVYQQSSDTWIHWSHPDHAGISSISFCSEHRILCSSYRGMNHFILLKEYMPKKTTQSLTNSDYMEIQLAS